MAAAVLGSGGVVVTPAAATGPDVAATVVGGPPVPSADTATFEVRAENLGGAPSAGTVEVRLGTSGLVSPASTGSGWTCDDWTSGTTCRTTAILAPGERAPVLVVTGRTTAVPGSAASLEAYTGPAGSQRRTSAVVSVVPTSYADVALAITSPAPVGRSEARPFDLRVRNTGLAPTPRPPVITFPRDAPPPTASGVGWACVRDERTCTFATVLAAGAEAPPVRATVAAGVSTYLSATVADGAQPHALLGGLNDYGSAVAVVRPDGDHLLTAAVAPDGPPSASPDGLSTTPYVVAVRNVGDGSTTGPTEVRFSEDRRTGAFSGATVEAAGDGWVCDIQAERCQTFATVAPGSALPPLRLRVRDDRIREGRVSTAVGVHVRQVGEASNTPELAPDAAFARQSVSGAQEVTTLSIAMDDGFRRGGVGRAVLRVRNAGDVDRSDPIDIAFDGPEGSTAEGAGWRCTGARGCRLPGGLDAGGTAPELVLRIPVRDDAPLVPIAVSASDVSDVPGGSGYVEASATIGTGPRDLTVVVPELRPRAFDESARVPFVVANSAPVDAPGPVTVTVKAPATEGSTAIGDGWRCVERTYFTAVCAHAGPVPARGALPTLEWRSARPLGLFSGEIGASLTAPAAGNGDVTNDEVGSTANASVEPPGPTAAFEDLVAATRERRASGRVVVRNARPVPVEGPVRVGWSYRMTGTDGGGWRCSRSSSSCEHPGPIPAGGALPALPFTTDAENRKDTTDHVWARTTTPQVQNGSETSATLPAARGPQPRLSVSVAPLRYPVSSGVTVPFIASATAEGDVTGRASFTLSPAPGLVVRDLTASGMSCDSNLRCTGPIALADGDRVVLRFDVRVAPDTKGPLPLRLDATADGVAPTSSTFDVLPLATTGDLTMAVQSGDPAAPGGVGSVLARVSNVGTERMEGPFSVHAYNGWSGPLDAPSSGDGWTCEPPTSSGTRCAHAGSLDPGESLPPLQVRGTLYTYGSGSTSQVSVGVSGGSPESVWENNFARATLPVSGAIGEDLAISLTTGGNPSQTGDALFEARVRNVGRSPAAGPVLALTDGEPFGFPRGSAAPVPGGGWSCPRHTGQCVLDGPLDPGQEAPPLRLRQAPADPSSGRPSPGPGLATVAIRTRVGTTRNDAASASVPRVSSSSADVVAAVSTTAVVQHGGSATHRVLVANLGSAATGEPVEVRIRRPEYGPLRTDGAGWTCPGAGRTCRLDAEGLAPGEQAPPLTVTVGDARSGARAALGIAVDVTGDGDGVDGNDIAVSSIGVPDDDLGIPRVMATFEEVAPVGRGERLRGRVRVRNIGSTATTEPVVLDLGPVDEARGSGWTCEQDGRDQRCTAAGVLGPGELLPPIDVVSDTSPKADAVTWDAQVLPQEPRAADDERPTELRTPLGGGPVDLAVAVTGGRPLVPGEQETLTARVTNVGFRPGTGPATLRLTAPAGVAVRPSGRGWTCEAARCEHYGAVAPGSALPPVSVELEPLRDAADGAVATTVKATVETPGDRAEHNDEGSLTVGVAAGPVDLLPKITPVGTARAGAPRVSHLEVRNAGAGSTTRPTTVTVDDPYVATLSGPGWECSERTCVREGPVAGDGTLPTIVATSDVPPDAAPAESTVSASVRNAADGAAGNDVATSSVGIGVPVRSGPFASPAVAVGAAIDQGAPGERIPIQVAVRATDPSAARSARTTVVLPEGLSPAGAPAGQPPAQADGRRLSWDEPTGEGREPRAWTFWARVDAEAAPGPRTLMASTTGPSTTGTQTHTATFLVTEPPSPDSPGGPGDPSTPTSPGTPTSPSTPTSPGTPSSPDAPAAAPSAATDPALTAWLAALAAGRQPDPPTGSGSGAGSRNGADAGGTASPSVRLVGALRPPRTGVLARSGWTITVRSSVAHPAIRVELRADAATARRLRVRTGTVLARGSRGAQPAKDVRVQLRVPTALRAKVRRSARITGTLRVRATSNDGVATATRRVTVRR